MLALVMDLFLTHSFSLPEMLIGELESWIIVTLLIDVWTLILRVPIHFRRFTGEQVR